MRRARILLVDDNSVNRRLLTAVLEAGGHRVDEARSGREAVEGARLLPYDLVLMDIQMADMDGVEAAAQIRALGGRQAEMPIIAISGDVSDDIAERCRAAGMNDHLAKPVNPDALQRLVERWTSSRSEEGTASSSAAGGGPPAPETPLGGLAANLSGGALLPIIDDFTHYAAARMLEIDSAVAAGEFPHLRSVAHDLSGSAANLGFKELGRMAQSIEIACMTDDVETAKRLVTEIPGVLRQVLAALATHRVRALALALAEGVATPRAALGDDAPPGGSPR